MPKIDDTDDDGNTSTESEEMSKSQNLKSVRMVEEVYGIRRSLSYIQEFASSIDVDQELLKTRIKGGAYLTNQLLVGGLSGWATALFFKKFGKIAFSAATGGLLLLIYSARKGYVNINYDSIYQELSKLCDSSEAIDFNQSVGREDDANEADPDLSNSINDDLSSSRLSDTLLGKNKSKSFQSPDSYSSAMDKVKTARRWLSSHTYTVGGFALTFFYNIV